MQCVPYYLVNPALLWRKSLLSHLQKVSFKRRQRLRTKIRSVPPRWSTSLRRSRSPRRPVFDLLLRYAISEDGALHSEKYYRTVTEEFAATRPAFRWHQLVALARVTASEYGYPAPGYAEACRLLKV